MIHGLNMSDAASLAMHGMAFLAGNRNGLVSAHEIARALDVSETHLQKVLQRLARTGLVKSSRGPGGGFALGKPRAKITLLDIYETIEGPFAPRHCLLEGPACGGRKCIFGGLLRTLNRQVKDYLAHTRLPALSVAALRRKADA